MNFLILLVYVFSSTGKFLSSQQVFVALSTLNILRFPLYVVPLMITGVTQVRYTEMKNCIFILSY